MRIERAGSGAGAPPQVYVELGNAKVRLLALGPADLQMAIDGRSSRAQPDHAVDSTSFTAEDVLTFAPGPLCGDAPRRVERRSILARLRTQEAPSQYSLMVYKFDRERATMLQVLLYRARSNLDENASQRRFREGRRKMATAANDDAGLQGPHQGRALAASQAEREGATETRPDKLTTYLLVNFATLEPVAVPCPGVEHGDRSGSDEEDGERDADANEE